MILIDKRKYPKVARLLKTVKINCLFARSVAEEKANGRIYVDDENSPGVFYIVHSYGMSLLLGDSNNIQFNTKFLEYALNKNGARNTHEWMQAFPNDWNAVLNNLFADKLIKSKNNLDDKSIELNTRVNFKFNLESYLSFKQNTTTNENKIVRTNIKIFKAMKGRVIPFYFWKSAEDFVKNGVGYSLFHNNQLASTAYSAFIHDNQLEIGIETVEAFRGKGFAQHTCSALIDYCLENNFESVWACRLENYGSYKLAMKLGFEPTLRIPYYRLSN